MRGPSTGDPFSAQLGTQRGAQARIVLAAHVQRPLLPDFLIRLDNGGIIAAEYKGSHIADGKDSDEKKCMGELWERRSNGHCAFAWVEVTDSKNWTPLKRAVERCSGA
jgi:hypothetical protein